MRRRLEILLRKTSLSGAEIAELARRASPRRFGAGELVVREGVRGDFWGLVTRGQVAVQSSEEGSSHSVLRRGASFGEAMLIEGQPSGSTVRAVCDCEVRVLRRADLLALVRQRSPGAEGQDSGAKPRSAISGLAVWAAVVLVMVVGGIAAMRRFSDGPGSGGRPATAGGDPSVRVMWPPDGQVVQRSSLVRVQAEVTEPGVAGARLQVDGIGVGQEARPPVGDGVWPVEWSWAPSSEGQHVLVVEVDREGGPAASAPVTVTVVPDGEVVFSSSRDGYAAVYTMGSDGADVQRVELGPGEARQPAMSGSGTLAYVVTPGGVTTTIRVLAEGGEERAADLVAGRDPAWSVDGRWLAFAASVNQVSQVHVIPAEGGAAQQVTSEAVYAGQPTWSPDGLYVAYAAERAGNMDLWISEVGGDRPRRLTDDPAIDWGPAWSPDGSLIAFVSNRTGTHQIYTVRIDGSDLQRLTDLEQGAEAPDWSPDGHWLALVAYTGEGAGVNAREIYVMRSDGRDAARLTENNVDDSNPGWGAGVQP